MVTLRGDAGKAERATNVGLLAMSHIVVLDKYSFFEYHLIPPNRIT